MISTIEYQILRFNLIFEDFYKFMTMTKSIQQCKCKGIIPLRAGILNDNSAFLMPQLSLKSKTNTNEKLIGYLVYPL